MAEEEKNHQDSISFELDPEDAGSLKRLAGHKNVRLSGRIVAGNLVIDQINFQSPIAGEDHPFSHVNAPFVHLLQVSA